MRELLLLESSDWPYMVAKDRAKKYATERFDGHLARFKELAGALEQEESERAIELLVEIEETDNVFPELNPETVAYRSGDPGGETEV